MIRIRHASRVSRRVHTGLGGTHSDEPFTVSSSTRLLAVLSLLGAGLTIGAGPVSAAAVEPYPFNDESLTLFKVPPYPASLITAGGRGVFATLTLNGLVSQDYGLTTNDTGLFTDELRHTWAHDEEYGDTGGQLNADPARLLHAVGVAVGDLDGNGTAADPRVEAAYLVRGSAGSDDHLYVMGSQGQGFPLLADKAITGGALSLAMTEKTATVPALLYVRYPTSLKAYRFNSGVTGKLVRGDARAGQRHRQRLGVLRHLPPAVVARPGRGPELQRRDPGQRPRGDPYETPGGLIQLDAQLLVPTGNADAVTLSSINGFTPLVHSLGWSDFAWQSGQVRYDWAPPVGAGGFPGVSVDGYSLAMTGRTASDNRSRGRPRWWAAT